jgi:threonine dehydrogenase-like Zn-dependent dehydrogenase
MQSSRYVSPPNLLLYITRTHQHLVHFPQVVGHPSALTLSASLSRPFGIISSVGVHSDPTFPIPTPLLYDKNLSFAFGRCPVRALVSRSKGVLERRKEAFEGFVERVVGIGEAAAAYERFERGEGGKVCFDPWK